MDEITELQRVKKIAVESKYWYPAKLIKAAIKAGVFMNLNKGEPYSYQRVYGMLREGKAWVTEKLANFAKENPATTAISEE